jgi:uncharacterized protein (TIGR02246 family)
MKKLNSNFLISLFLFGILFGCAQNSKKVDVEADIAAINDLYKQATLACSNGDVELYLSLFTEDAVAMATEVPALIGKEQLRPAIEGLFGMFDLKLPYTMDKVEVPGDWAFARSSFQYSMTLKEGGKTTTRAGKELDILKRQADGSWKIYIESWSYDAPPVVE